MPQQKPNSKLPAFVNDATGWAINKAAKGAQRIFGLQPNWHHQLDMAKNNYNLGLLYLARGDYGNAVFRFRVATWVNARHPQAWYQLGRAYLGEGKKVAAANAFEKASTLMPQSEEMSYMEAVLGGNKTPLNKLPKRMPPALCLEHFDILAESYDDEQLGTYGYRGHILLSDAVVPYLVEGRLDHEVLDLGVGTGLVGARLSDISARIIGVDFSPKMLGQAMKVQVSEGKKLYSQLILRDAADYVQATPPATFDIVLAGGLLSYIGDVQPLLEGVASVLKNGGIFAFTADKCAGADYRFLPDAGRFGFTQPYLETLVTNSGLSVVSFVDAEIYPGYFAWLCVARK